MQLRATAGDARAEGDQDDQHQRRQVVPKPAESNGCAALARAHALPADPDGLVRPVALAISPLLPGGRRSAGVDAIGDRGRLGARCLPPAEPSWARRITERQSVYSSRSDGSCSSARSSSDCEYLPFSTPSSLQSRITLVALAWAGATVAAHGEPARRRASWLFALRTSCSWWVATSKR